MSKFDRFPRFLLKTAQKRCLNFDMKEKNMMKEEFDKLQSLKRKIKNFSTQPFFSKRGFIDIFFNNFLYMALFAIVLVFFSDSEIYKNSNNEKKLSLISRKMYLLYCKIYVNEFISIHSDLILCKYFEEQKNEVFQILKKNVK